MNGVDDVANEIEGEVDRRMEALRDDSEGLRRYDLYGDGRLDEKKWAEIRQVIALEVQTEHQRRAEAEATSEDGEVLEVLRGRFELRRELGRGAQGRTFLGWDRSDGRKVAVKELLLRDVEDWKAIELFEREGEALKYLDHPGIPGYVDAFHYQEGSGERFFLVQEFVDGKDFETLVDEGMTFTEDEAKEFLEELFEILIYLQERSPPVIHRDIKPSNVMRGADERLALIDFGAVQSVIPQEGGGSTIIGTSGYMPMEQLMGRAEPATDLYAVGATAVHLLSRRHPADLPMEEMRLKFQSFVNVSRNFEDYLETLLDPHVEARFSTAEEALRELRRLDEPRAPSRPAPVAAPPSPPAPAESVDTSDSITVDVEDSEEIDDSLHVPTSSSGVSGDYGGVDEDDLMLTDQGPWWYDSKLFEAAIACGIVLFVVGIVGILLYMEIRAQRVTLEDECGEGDPHACVQWGQQVEDSDPAKAERAYARGCELNHDTACFNQGVMALRRGDYDDAISPLEKACDMDSPDACTNLAAILEDGDPRADDAAKKACDLDSYLGCANYANTFLWRFEDAMAEEDRDEARRQVRRAWRYADRGCQGESESGCYRLALAELYQGNLDDAIRSAQRALALNDQHPHTHKVYGLAVAAEGDVDEAIDSLESALEAARDPGGDERPVFVDPMGETTANILRRLAILERIYPDRTEALVEVYEHFAQ